MAITNHERVGKALELLNSGLGPFAARELKNVYQANVQAEAAVFMGEDCLLAKKPIAVSPETVRLAEESASRGTKPAQATMI